MLLIHTVGTVPPSIRLVPVINPARGLHRKVTASATSSARPTRLFSSAKPVNPFPQMINNQAWPFREPPDCGVLTTRQVLAGIYPVLCIVHESGPAGWSFLDLQETGFEDIVGVTLREMFDFPGA